jgi:anti-sigma factor RsiW
MSCPYAMTDAAYVLGSLSPAERKDFESHLDECPECSLAVRDLAGLPGLLARVDPEVFEGMPKEPVPDTLLPRLGRAVRRRQYHRTWLTAGVAAAAAAAITVGGSMVLQRGDTGAPVADPPSSIVTPSGTPMTPFGSDPMSASVALTSVQWGTRLDLTCSYPDWRGRGGYASGSYALVVHTTDGSSERVATWHGLPGKTMHLTGSTSARAADIRSVEVVHVGGAPVLHLNL